MQNKFPMLFLDPNGDYVEQDVFTKPASNIVRKELQAIEKELQIASVKISKQIQKDFPQIFEMQKKNDGDLDKVLEAQADLSVSDYETVQDLNREVTDLNNKALFKEINIIIDRAKTVKKAKLKNYQVEQLNSAVGDIVIVQVGQGEEKEEIEFDFWENQDLETLRTEKLRFFQRVGI